MNDQDLKLIEAALGVSLPAEYRSVMAGPAAQTDFDFFYGGLYNDPNRIVAETLDLRDIAASYNLSCPKTWVVVSEINGGDLVFIDASETGAPLHYWNHETLTVEDATNSVAEFVESTLEVMRTQPPTP